MELQSDLIDSVKSQYMFPSEMKDIRRTSIKSSQECDEIMQQFIAGIENELSLSQQNYMFGMNNCLLTEDTESVIDSFV